MSPIGDNNKMGMSVKFLAPMMMIGMLFCGVVPAGAAESAASQWTPSPAPDYSASIASGGINLYSISSHGVALVKGSPYILPQPGVAHPRTPAIVAINPTHDFLYVVYEQLPYHGDLADDVSLVGFRITSRGLRKEWSYDTNLDPNEYRYISLTAGVSSVILNTKPSGLFATVFDQSGEFIAGDGSLYGSDQLLSSRVDPDNNLYYSCRANASGIKYVEVYSLPPHGMALQKLVTTSYDAAFMQSVCNQ
jgi:hypothetical protein